MIRQIFLFGDSLTEGSQLSIPSSNRIYDGGLGSWWEMMTERFAMLPEIGGLISSGIRAVGSNVIWGNGEWSFSGTWTGVTSGSAQDKMPYSNGATGSIQSASGISNVATYTTSTYWREPVGYAIYYLDYTSGGNWQYRIDGGAWTNMNQTLAHDNNLAKFYVSSALGSGVHTIDIRGYDGSADCGVLPAGIEVFFVDPTQPNLNGLIVHNVAIGGRFLSQLFGGGTSDRLAIVDSVKLGTNAISNVPNMGVYVMHINDVAFNNVTQWGNQLQSFYNRMSPLGPCGFFSPWECNGNATNQATFRAKTKTIASNNNTHVLDFYDEWTNLGIGTGVGTQKAAAIAEGFLDSADGGTHETQLAHQDLGIRVYNWLKSSVWPMYNYVGPTVQHFNISETQLADTPTIAGTPSYITQSHSAIPIVGAQDT